MGCFNKGCVVTGLQITNNDPIVGIKLKKSDTSHRYKSDSDFDHIGSEWYPIEFPVRGIYDDYGRIEVDGKLYEGDEARDYDSTRCDDYMFVHEWAYDYILAHAAKERKEYKEKGYTDWDQKTWDEIKESFDTLKTIVDDGTLKTMSHRAIIEMVIRAKSESYFQLYFALENKNYWFDKLYVEDYDEYYARVNKFNDELGVLETYRFELGFQWHPSYIANQEVDYDLRLGLLSETEKYLKDNMSKYFE